jgi:hypothetical protein
MIKILWNFFRPDMANDARKRLGINRNIKRAKGNFSHEISKHKQNHVFRARFPLRQNVAWNFCRHYVNRGAFFSSSLACAFRRVGWRKKKGQRSRARRILPRKRFLLVLMRLGKSESETDRERETEAWAEGRARRMHRAKNDLKIPRIIHPSLGSPAQARFLSILSEFRVLFASLKYFFFCSMKTGKADFSTTHASSDS